MYLKSVAYFKEVRLWLNDYGAGLRLQIKTSREFGFSEVFRDEIREFEITFLPSAFFIFLFLL